MTGSLNAAPRGSDDAAGAAGAAGAVLKSLVRVAPVRLLLLLLPGALRWRSSYRPTSGSGSRRVSFPERWSTKSPGALRRENCRERVPSDIDPKRPPVSEGQSPWVLPTARVAMFSLSSYCTWPNGFLKSRERRCLARSVGGCGRQAALEVTGAVSPQLGRRRESV